MKKFSNSEILKVRLETTIYDGMGNKHKGYICDARICKGCPYITEDEFGNDACYKEEYTECLKNWRDRE